jgi:hypothetical protein
MRQPGDRRVPTGLQWRRHLLPFLAQIAAVDFNGAFINRQAPEVILRSSNAGTRTVHALLSRRPGQERNAVALL